MASNSAANSLSSIYWIWKLCIQTQLLLFLTAPLHKVIKYIASFKTSVRFVYALSKLNKEICNVNYNKTERTSSFHSSSYLLSGLKCLCLLSRTFFLFKLNNISEPTSIRLFCVYIVFLSSHLSCISVSNISVSFFYD